MKRIAIIFVTVTLLNFAASVFFALWPYRHNLGVFRTVDKLWASYKIQSSNLDVCLLSVLTSILLPILLGACHLVNRKGRLYFLLQTLLAILPPFYQVRCHEGLQPLPQYQKPCIMPVQIISDSPMFCRALS